MMMMMMGLILKRTLHDHGNVHVHKAEVHKKALSTTKLQQHGAIIPLLWRPSTLVHHGSDISILDIPDEK